MRSGDAGRYVRGNPISRTDPSGLCDTCDAINKSIGNWWEASKAGFQSESFGDAVWRIFQAMPAEGAVMRIASSLIKAIYEKFT